VAKSPFKGKFSEFFYKVQQRTPIDVFLPEFHAEVSRYKEMRVHCTVTEKNMHIFAAILRPFGPAYQNFNP